MSKSFKAFIIAMIVVLAGAFTYLLFFDGSFMAKQYPYKFTALKEQKKKLADLEADVERIQKENSDSAKTLEQQKDTLQSESQEIQKLRVEATSKYHLPGSIDYASLLIFIEEKALVNNVYLTNLDLFENENSNQSFDDELPMPPSSGDIQNETITLGVIGSYQDIEKFIQTVNENIGDFNYVSEINLYRGEKELFDPDIITGTKKDDTPAYKKNKNVIAKLVITMNYKPRM